MKRWYWVKVWTTFYFYIHRLLQCFRSGKGEHAETQYHHDDFQYLILSHKHLQNIISNIYFDVIWWNYKNKKLIVFQVILWKMFGNKFCKLKEIPPAISLPCYMVVWEKAKNKGFIILYTNMLLKYFYLLNFSFSFYIPQFVTFAFLVELKSTSFIYFIAICW